MTQALQGAQYDGWSCTRTRTRTNGLAVMPIAGPSPQPLAIVGLNGGMEMETVVFAAVKRGEPPTVPSPITHNNNRLLLGGGQSAAIPIPDPGGPQTYVIAGAYTYAIINPEGLDSEFMLGALPFQGLNPTDEQIDADVYFQDYLVNWNQNTPIPGGQQETIPNRAAEIGEQG